MLQNVEEARGTAVEPLNPDMCQGQPTVAAMPCSAAVFCGVQEEEVECMDSSRM